MRFFAQPLLVVHHQTMFWTDNSYTGKKQGALFLAHAIQKARFLKKKKNVESGRIPFVNVHPTLRCPVPSTKKVRAVLV